MNRSASKLVATYLGCLLGLALLATAVGFVGGAAAADSAPDCGEVGYETNGSGFYEVTNVSQLQCIEDQGLDQAYVLTTDVDASGTDHWYERGPFTETRSVFDSTLPVTVELGQAPIDGQSVTVVDDLDESVDVTVVSQENGVIEIDDGQSFTGPIDVSYRTQDPVPVGFDPIGEDGAAFTGTFDGNGFTISGLTIDRGHRDYVGLFGKVDGGTVENAGVRNVDVTGGRFVGGLVGRNAGTVRTSDAAGDVAGNVYVGGLVGWNHQTVRESYAAVDVVGPDSAGGLVGTHREGTIRSSYATGNVSGDQGVGGLVGDTMSDISSSYASGSVSGSSDTGGLVGYNLEGSFDTSYWDSQRTGQASSAGTATRLTTEQMQTGWAAGNMSGLDFDDEWDAVAGDFPDLQSNPRLESTNHWSSPGDAERARILDALEHHDGTYNVTSDRALQAIGHNGTTLGWDYRLVVDVDASGTGAWNGGSGFDPIGDAGTPFSGTFDGGGHAISDLTIERSGTTAVGTFGSVSAGTIANVTIRTPDVTGDDDVGALVGDLSGGTVTGTTIQGGTVAATASGDEDQVGGTIGVIHDGTLRHSNASVTVDVPGGVEVGGLVGDQADAATVETVSFTGTVTGGDRVGGILGDANDGSTLHDAFAAGTVTGTTDVGGLVGRQGGSGGTVDVQDAYWDEDATGQSGTAGGGTGLSTGDMQSLNATVAMHGLDFYDTWMPRDGGYPEFARDSPFATGADAYDALVAGDGTSGTPYEVTDVYELQAMNTSLDAHVEVQNDIDASGTSAWYGGDGFAPIGDTGTAFSGTLDGDGHTIANLTIARSGTGNEQALVGVTSSDAAVRDLTLDGVAIEGLNVVAGVVAKNAGTVHDVTVTGEVTGLVLVGSIAAENEGNITNSTAAVAVEGDIAGGLVGTHETGHISGSVATGDVTGTDFQGGTGGFVGRIYGGTITESAATGDVTHDTGDTNDDYGAGGFVGSIWNGSVTESFATGNVSGEEHAGGFVGDHSGHVENVYATGTVDGNVDVGGLVGTNDGTVTTSFATGTVEGGAQTGGLVGTNDETFEDAYWDAGTTNRTDAVGVNAGTTTGLRGFGSPSDAGPATEMQRFAPQSTMDALDYGDTWVVTRGYPALAWEDTPAITVDGVEASDTTVAEDESGAIAVTARENGTNAGAGVTVTVVDDGGLDGFDDGDARVTDASGQATFALDEPDHGVFTPEFAWEGNASVAATATVTVQDAPEVSSIERASGASNPTSAASVEFAVTFTEPVSNVGAGDFTATQVSGDVSGAVDVVSGSGSSYTVTVADVQHDGDLRLDLSDDDSITSNGTGVELGGVGTSGTADGSYTSGEAYTVDDTAPTTDPGDGSGSDDGSTDDGDEGDGEADEELRIIVEGDTDDAGNGSVSDRRTLRSIVENAPAGSVVRLDTATTGRQAVVSTANVVVSDVSMQTARDRERARVNVTSYEHDVDSAATDGSRVDGDVLLAARAFEETTGSVSAGYLAVDHDFEPGDLDSVRINYSVRKAYLDDIGVVPDDVTLYRNADGETGWSALDGDRTGENATHYRYTSQSPGFSVFAIGTGAPALSLSVDPLETDAIALGEVATVTATVENRGTVEREIDLELTAANETVATESVVVAGGDAIDVSLAFEPERAGDYALALDGEPAGSLTVESPASDPETPPGAPEEAGGSSDGGGESPDDAGGFPLWLAGATGLAIAVLAGGFVYRRRSERGSGTE